MISSVLELRLYLRSTYSASMNPPILVVNISLLSNKLVDIDSVT